VLLGSCNRSENNEESGRGLDLLGMGATTTVKKLPLVGTAEKSVASARRGDDLEGYLEDRQRHLLRLLRGGTIFGLLAVAVSAVANTLVFTDRLPERLLTHALQAAMLAATALATSLPGAGRWAHHLAVALMLGINTSLLWSLSLSPGDLDVLTAVVVSVLGTCALLLPLGVRAQAFLAVYTVLGFVFLPPWPDLSPTRKYNVGLGLLLGAGSSVICAAIVDRHRRATWVERERALMLARMKSEFVSMMSHELRTPINVILGYTDMIRTQSPSPEELDEDLRRIEAAGHDLLTLIENTLQIGKLEAGRDEIHLERISLPAFWTELGRSCARLPRRPEVEFVWEGDLPPVSVATEPRRLTLIVRNLVGNALKFTERGSVRASLALQQNALQLRVADTGIGIKAEDRDAIFEMYRQARKGTPHRLGGSGLGLYIVRRFVGQLGGTIQLESEPGRGSTFTVTLPVHETSPIATAA